MALVLSMKEGQDFFVGDEEFIVTKVLGDEHFIVSREKDGRLFDVTDKQSVEIMDDVYVSAGDRPMPFLARVAIEAPRSITILRGTPYRENLGYAW